jgi:hypothetical protein
LLGDPDSGCAERLGDTYSSNLARPQISDRIHEGRNKWKEVFESVTRGNQNKDGKRGPCQVLLELKILIGGHEDVEAARRCASQQLAVSQPGPPLLLHGSGLMPRELPRQLSW